jgi:hypothetical protein
METHITTMEDVSGRDPNAERRSIGGTNETMHQCTECGWSMDGNDQATEVERNRRAIEHHIETGHAVVSRSPPPKRGSADERSEGRHRTAE